MKKIFKSLLILLFCVCLINTNHSFIKADEPYKGTLFYGCNNVSTCSFYKNYDQYAQEGSKFSNEYDEQTDKWSVVEDENNHWIVTLKDGFEYTKDYTVGDYDSAIIFITNPYDVIINGKVTINQNDSGAAFSFNGDDDVEIKGDEESNIVNKLIINIKGRDNYGKGIDVKSEDENNPRTLYFTGCEIDINGKSMNPFIESYYIKIYESKLNVVNKGDGHAMLFHGLPKSENGNAISFIDEDSELYLEGHSGSGAVFVQDENLSQDDVDTFNNQYAPIINNDDNNLRGYLATNGEINIGDTHINAKKLTFLPSTGSGNVFLAYDATNGWQLLQDGIGGSGKFPGEGTKYKVEGDKTHPKLTLMDGFSIVNANRFTFYINVSNIPDVELTIKTEGKANIISTYHNNSDVHDEYHFVFTPITDPSFVGCLKSIVFEGTNDSVLNIFSGTTSSYVTGNPISIQMAALYVDDADVTFKNGTYNIISRDHLDDYGSKGATTAASGALVGYQMKNLTLDNAKVNLTAGNTETDLNVATQTVDKHLGTALVNGDSSSEPAKLPYTIKLTNNSVLTLNGTCATLFLNEDVLQSLSAYDIKNYYSMYTKGYDLKEYEVKGKYGDPELSSLGFPSFYTFYYYYDEYAPVFASNLPCFKTIISNKTGGGSTPSKDESCEKVIGPTWHWNNDKGICEEVGVVGTSTR